MVLFLHPQCFCKFSCQEKYIEKFSMNWALQKRICVLMWWWWWWWWFLRRCVILCIQYFIRSLLRLFSPTLLTISGYFLQIRGQLEVFSEPG